MYSLCKYDITYHMVRGVKDKDSDEAVQTAGLILDLMQAKVM